MPQWKGSALPWATGLKGLAEQKPDDDILATSVLFIALTGYGERVMLPDFGTNIHQLVFDQLDGQTVSAFESSLRNAVRKYDPRVEVISVAATRPGDNILHLDVRFRVKNDPLNPEERTISVDLPASLVQL